MTRNNSGWLEALFVKARHGIIIFDKDGDVAMANPAAGRILGRTLKNIKEFSEDSPDKGMIDQFGKLLSLDRYPAMVALNTSAGVEDFIIGIHNPDLKERRWISVDAGPLFEVNQTGPIAAYCVFVDITEQKNGEHELRQSKMHLALAQSIASIGSAAVDFRTGKWDWSEETFRIYGVSPDAFVPAADTLSTLVHPEDWPLLHSHFRGAQKGVTPDPIEYRIRRPDGAERVLRRIATLVRDDNGTVTGIVGTVQDITELREALQAKLALENQLYHAQKLDSLGVLASGIAHDLNNTLVPIVALSQTILDELQPRDPSRPLLDLIREGGERARDLVAQILAFARRDTVESTLINIRIFLENSLRLLRAAIPSSIEIVADLAQTAHVRGNRGQLHQIIVNLLSNAAQAIGDRPGKIYLSTRLVKKGEENQSQNFLCIAVTDTGCGMSDEIKARIFEPFFTTKRVGNGTGLGLSVVHGLVTAHDGWIRVTSVPGEGSSFEVLLPIAA